jgi:uncharacterized protein (TIGR02271 family)
MSQMQQEPMIVIDKNGLIGEVFVEDLVSPTRDSHLLVHFENGQQLLIPSEMLIRHADGRYRLLASVAELAAREEGRSRQDASSYDLHAATGGLTNTNGLTNAEEMVIPVVDEEVTIQTRQRQSGIVEIRKTVHERTETVDQPLLSEAVEVERVTINRIVEEPVSVRQEGDTMIIPLLEEVLVVEKRLLLREEVHIKKLRREVHDPQEVLLREERVEIVRKAGSDRHQDQFDAKQ